MEEKSDKLREKNVNEKIIRGTASEVRSKGETDIRGRLGVGVTL